MVFVKICGITTLEDGLAACRSGADAVGFVFAESPRHVSRDQAHKLIQQLPPEVKKVGVFVNQSKEEVEAVRSFCGLDLVQLHGDETEDEAAGLGSGVIKAIRIGPCSSHLETIFPTATLLLDTASPIAKGGTGRTFDWNLAVAPARCRPIILAGGLTVETVANAVRTVRPYGVDVSSGVEKEPGRKDHEKLACFIRRAKAANRCAR